MLCLCLVRLPLFRTRHRHGLSSKNVFYPKRAEPMEERLKYSTGTPKPKTQLRSVRKEVWGKTGGRCAYCGKELNPFIFSVDHLIPLSKGGPDETENMMPACKSCNSSKGTKLLEDFRELIHNRPIRALITSYDVIKAHFESGYLPPEDWKIFDAGIANLANSLQIPPVVFYFERTDHENKP